MLIEALCVIQLSTILGPGIHLVTHTSPRVSWLSAGMEPSHTHLHSIHLHFTKYMGVILICPADLQKHDGYWWPGPWFNTILPPYQYRKSYWGDKTIFSICSYNGLVPARRQAIIWTNDEDRLISPMGFPILVRCYLYTELGSWCQSYLGIGNSTVHCNHWVRLLTEIMSIFCLSVSNVWHWD